MPLGDCSDPRGVRRLGAACAAAPPIWVQLTLRRQSFYSFICLMWGGPFCQSWEPKHPQGWETDPCRRPERPQAPLALLLCSRVSGGQERRGSRGLLRGGHGTTKSRKHFFDPQEMENAWNEYLKLERDVEQLKQTLQEQHRRAFFFQVTRGSPPAALCLLPGVCPGGGREPYPGPFSVRLNSACAPPKLSLGGRLPLPGCHEKRHLSSPCLCAERQAPQHFSKGFSLRILWGNSPKRRRY